MDILYLLDRLEETLTSGTQVPFTARSLIDEQEALDILDQVRVAIPEEVKQARRLVAERDSIIAEANEQAERVVLEAEQRVQERVNDHALVQEAERRALEIRDDALQAAEQLRRDMDQYSYRVLARVHGQLQTLLEQVERGMRALEEEAAEGVEAEEHSKEEITGR